MTKYVVGGKISSAKLKKLLAGQSVTMNNDGDTNVNLHFKKLKDYNRYVRNLSANKGFRLKTDHLEDLQDHEGGSFFGSIKRAFHKIGDVGKHAGHKIENIGKRAVKKSIPVLKEVGKVALPIAKETAKVALPIAKEVVQQGVADAVTAYTGNPIAGKVAGQMAGNATQAVGNKVVGTGFMKMMKKVGNASKNIALDVAKDSAKDMLKQSIKGAMMSKSGTGLVDEEGEDTGGLGGNKLIKSSMLQSEENRKKMEYVRSHRKKRKVGGSFLPPS